MPTYVYETISDNPAKIRRFEVQQRMSEAPLATDPESGLPVRRVISGGIGIPKVEAKSGGGAAPHQHGPGCGHHH
jgi:predicted nucleic acid-binding Zn ribbon protein